MPQPIMRPLQHQFHVAESAKIGMHGDLGDAAAPDDFAVAFQRLQMAGCVRGEYIFLAANDPAQRWRLRKKPLIVKNRVLRFRKTNAQQFAQLRIQRGIDLPILEMFDSHIFHAMGISGF